LITPAIVNKLKWKISMLLGSLTYVVWILCFTIPAYYSENLDSDSFIFNKTFITVFLIIISSINGFGAGLLWVAWGEYISLCAC